jgi:predicted metallopeptidase
MFISNLLGASVSDMNYDANEIDEILGQNDGYIIALAREKVPRHIASPEVLDLEIHELAHSP